MNRKILVTGGTAFVSRYIAQYFRDSGDDITVLNRGTRTQPDGVNSILCDRHALGDSLKNKRFDAVLDATAYTEQDVSDLLAALPPVKDYILLSSGAVYSETAPQPICENSPIGYNIYWKDYGIHKFEAEQYLRVHMPDAYVIRPPYLYGPGENLYRELFCFDCALANHPFYVPQDGSMQLQFFHVKDLCHMMNLLLESHPQIKTFNVGNPETVSVKEWVTLCYASAGKEADLRFVPEDIPIRSYFCFYDYTYKLDVSRQKIWMPYVTPLQDGLKETFAWYTANLDSAEVNRKPYREFLRMQFTDE